MCCMCRRFLFAVVGIFTNFSQFDSIRYDLLSEIRLARTPTHTQAIALSSAQPRHHRHRRHHHDDCQRQRHHHHPHEASLARSLGGSTPRSRGGRALKFDLDCE